ncbi:MAG: sporulation protein [Candidatus Sericytochromatia bacterium]|nr:sporulation protein [Candidatus Sericytochromatia bacterium]
MFDKFLARVGIGNARVETRLNEAKVQRGNFLNGDIRLRGGNVDQEVRCIYLDLLSSYREEDHTGRLQQRQFSLHRMNIDENFSLAAGEEIVFDFELEVPWISPVSFGPFDVRLRTGLDIEKALDPKNSDVIEVLPDPATEQVMLAFEDLGFQHQPDSGQSVAMPNDVGVPYVQIFLMDGLLRGYPVSLDIVVMAHEAAADFQVELPGAGRMLRFSVPQETPFAAADLQNLLEEQLG